ncbi:MAG: transglycosylase SLT domain-containing protein, partial [Mailhella sp.]|nr:transglycosylase SLT domain-containing protein [Mailhella sp.]
YQNTAPLQKEEHVEKQSSTSKNMPGKIYRNITASSQERPNFIENISRTEIISLMPHLAKDKYRSDTRKSYSKRKKAITPYVNRYADKFGLDRNLIMSIIEVESNFIPQALSKQNAHGLMQVVPNTAAAEVNRFFKHKQEVTDMELMHPENNIYYGTAYLYLIKKYHLNGITDHDSLNSLLIASYNAGSSAVLRHFGETKEKAIRAINAMSPQEVYNSLIQNYRSGETREYLKRVTENLS